MLGELFGNCVGKKFNSDGSVRFFPGNTIICILDHETEVYRKVLMERETLKKSSIASCLSFLPDESLHMTALEGVTDQNRKKWSSKMPNDCKLSEVDDFFEKTFPTLPSLGTVFMTFDHLKIETALCIGLSPATKEDEQRIRNWRDETGEALGLHFPGHETYEFHISLAYGYRKPDKRQQAVLEGLCDAFAAECLEHPFSFKIPKPSLTYFDNMFYFSTTRIPRR